MQQHQLEDQDDVVVTKRAFLCAMRGGDIATIERFFEQPSVQEAVREAERGIRARETERPLLPASGAPLPWYLGKTSLIFTDEGAVAPDEVFVWFFQGPFTARAPHTLGEIVVAGLLLQLGGHGNVALIELVVTSPVFQDPFVDATRRSMCLDVAAMHGANAAALGALIAHGAAIPMDIDAVDALGFGATESVSMEATISSRVKNGATIIGHGSIIGYAIVLGASASVVRTLISLGADARSSSPSPIHRAVTHGKPKVIETLITHGIVNFEAPQASPQSSPLLVAVYGLTRADNFRVRHNISELLVGGADPNIRGPQGETPLHIAAARGGPMALLALLSHGGDPNALCARGRTPLHVVAETADADVQSWHLTHLLRFRADPTIHDAQGWTPLHLLAVRPREPWVRNAINKLVEVGADLLAVDQAAQTPIDLLRRDATGRLWANKLLRRRGATATAGGH